jgi:hypothetical protein
VSVLTKPGRLRTPVPIALPAKGAWFVRIIARQGRFVFGVYRRKMKTIGYLGQIDNLFGALAITRNWNTMMAILRILKSEEKRG